MVVQNAEGASAKAVNTVMLLQESTQRLNKNGRGSSEPPTQPTHPPHQATSAPSVAECADPREHSAATSEPIELTGVKR